MATYDFTNSWDLGTYTKDDITYTFSQSDYSNAINAAQETYAYNQGGYGDYGTLAPGGSGGSHSSDLQASFGSSHGNGSVNLLNFVDFDYSDDGASGMGRYE